MNKLELTGTVSVSVLEGQWGYYKEAYFEDEDTSEDLTDVLVEYEGKRIKITVEVLD